MRDVGNAADAHNSDGFPKIYRSSRFWIVFSIIFGVIITIGITAFTIHYEFFEYRHNAGQKLFFAVFNMSFLMFLSFIIAKTLKSFLILEEDSIELVSIFSSRHLKREDIAFKSFILFAGGQAIVLHPKSKAQRRLSIDYSTFKVDATFKSWMARVPDLTAASVRDRH